MARIATERLRLAERLDLDAFLAQAMEYRNWEDPSDRVRRFFTS